MSPSIEIDPERLPSDWRKVVKVGAFVILLGIGGAILAAGAAEATVGKRLDAHVSEQTELPQVLKQMDRKLDALCRANPAAACPLGSKE